MEGEGERGRGGEGERGRGGEGERGTGEETRLVKGLCVTYCRALWRVVEETGLLREWTVSAEQDTMNCSCTDKDTSQAMHTFKTEQ